MLNKVAVISSNIQSIGWEYEILEVTFSSGATYQAKGVQQSIFDNFIAAKSKGKYFNANLKNSYKWDKVG